MTKKLMLWLGISLVCFTAFVLSARAVEKETVSLTNVDGQIEATLELPEMPAEEIVALQLSFQIGSTQGSIGKEEVSFAFDAGLPKEALQQCRYQEDTGVLTIYISGNQDLYPKGNAPSAGNPKLSLGKVVVNSDRDASVKVVKNSFKTVNKAHGMYEGEVNTGDGGQIINNGSTDKDTNSTDKDTNRNPDPEQIENNNSTSGENSKPGDGSDSGDLEKNGILAPAQNEKKEKGAAAIRTIGVSEKIMDAVRTEGTDSGQPVMTGNEDGQEEPTLPEDSLWEEGAKLWREKTGSVDMEVWTKIFFGLFAASALVASTIAISLAVQSPGKRKKRRKRRTYARKNGQPPTQIKNVSRKKPVRPSQRSLPESRERRPEKRATVKGHAKSASVRKKQTVRKTRGKSPYREQPVWKDDNKTYVRKRRKIS